MWHGRWAVGPRGRRNGVTRMGSCTGFARRSPTLRAISASTVVILVGMIAMIGVLGFTATQYQGSMFSSTLSTVQETSEVLGALDRSLTEDLGPMIEVLYRPAGGAELDQSVEANRESSAAVSAAFDRAEEALAGRGSATELAAVRETWESVDAVVRASPEEWSNEGVARGVRAGLRSLAGTGAHAARHDGCPTPGHETGDRRGDVRVEENR